MQPKYTVNAFGILYHIADSQPLFLQMLDDLFGNDRVRCLVFMKLIVNALLDEPCGEHATALFELIRDFQDWDVSDLEAYTWFMTDIEWSWMDGRTPIEDW